MAASGIDEFFNDWYSRFNSGTYVIHDDIDNKVLFDSLLSISS